MGATHGTPRPGAPTDRVPGPRELAEQKPPSVVTSANPCPAREIPAESPRVWESPSPCTDLPSPAAAAGRTGRLHPPRLSWGPWCCHPEGCALPWDGGSVSLLCCWDVSSQCPWLSAVGALGLAPFPHAWLCTGAVLGTPVMLGNMAMGNRAAFLPSPPPSATSQCCCRTVSGFWVQLQDPHTEQPPLPPVTPPWGRIRPPLHHHMDPLCHEPHWAPCDSPRRHLLPQTHSTGGEPCPDSP